METVAESMTSRVTTEENDTAIEAERSAAETNDDATIEAGHSAAEMNDGASIESGRSAAEMNDDSAENHDSNTEGRDDAFGATGSDTEASEAALETGCIDEEVETDLLLFSTEPGELSKTNPTTIPETSFHDVSFHQQVANLSFGSSELDESDRDSINSLLHQLADDITNGNISDAVLEKLLHALHYERDMAEADRKGEIRGRNLRIEKYLEELKAASKTHSIPSSKPKPTVQLPYDMIGGLSAADRLNIWERGRERRMKY